MIGSERRVVDDQTAQLQALALARSGVERYLSDREQLGFTTMPPVSPESTRVNFANGYADVVLELVRQGTGFLDPNIYILRSRGVRTGQAGATISERSVAQYTRWQWPTMQVNAAWTSLSGIVKPDAAGMISGLDACGMAPAVAGVAVPGGAYSQVDGESVPVGSPNVLDLGDTTSANASVHVDWNAANEEATAIQPDVMPPGQPWPEDGRWADPTFWPLVVVHGDYTLPSSGRGILLVTGNLTIPAEKSWNGVVLVGRAIYGNTGVTISGVIISGLSAKYASDVPPSDAGAGDVTYQYSSCDVSNALSRFRGLSPYRNASIDNWPAY
jgi:hypothetical protein